MYTAIKVLCIYHFFQFETTYAGYKYGASRLSNSKITILPVLDRVGYIDMAYNHYNHSQVCRYGY